MLYTPQLIVNNFEAHTCECWKESRQQLKVGMCKAKDKAVSLMEKWEAAAEQLEAAGG